MALLKLLADMMMYLLKMPYNAIMYLNQFISQRMATQKAVSGVGEEVRVMSRAGRFFRFLALVLLWLLIVAVLVGILVGLWYLNDALNLERVLGGPLPSLRPFWLPLLLVLFILSCWVGYRLFRSLGPDRDIVEFADLDEAWTEARTALVEAGIDLKAVPLFLVLGRPASSFHALMSASHLTFAVQQIPLKPNPPLQVYANRQAVYVVAPDACLMGRQAELLFESKQTTEPASVKPAAATVFDEPVETLAGAETASTPAAAVLTVDPRLATQNLLAEAAPASAAVAELPAPASEPGAMPWMAEGHLRMPALLNRTEETEKYQRRLRYLMRCINRDRAPYCPLNGVILLLPFAALANDEDVSQIASVCQADLRVLRESARTRCPVFLLVADLETAPGYPALRECLDLDRRLRLFGQDLPLIPDLKPEELPGMIAGSLRHFTQALTHWIFRLFRVEKSGLEQAAAAIAANGQLFELLGTIRHRAPGLERILTRLITADPPLEFMVGGFYLAATGSNPERDQAFVPGVFQHLVQHQNAVAWTQDALDEEADYRRWTVYGYAALAIFCIAVTVIIYGRWQMLHW